MTKNKPVSRFAYYRSSNGFRGLQGDLLTAVTGLPAWARLIVVVLAIPGICLGVLSLIALLASMATVLLLTVPAYVLLRRLVGLFGGKTGPNQSAEAPSPRPARRIETVVVEAGTPVRDAAPPTP